MSKKYLLLFSSAIIGLSLVISSFTGNGKVYNSQPGADTAYAAIICQSKRSPWKKHGKQQWVYHPHFLVWTITIFCSILPTVQDFFSWKLKWTGF
jgi:hypothetical protein